MDIKNNYLLLFKINIKDAHSFRGWSDFLAKVNEEVSKHRPKSTLVSPSQKALYQTLSDRAKELEAMSGKGVIFADFLHAQLNEMLAFQVEKTEEIKRTLHFCEAEKLKSPDFVKTLCAEYAQFQITEDVILSLIKTVIVENENDSGGGDFSDYLSKEEAKAIEVALVNAGREDASLYQVLEKSENSSIEELQKQAGKFYESARKSNDGALSSLFGQCFKIFKTNDSKQKYDNYLKISKYKKINRNIEDPIRLTGAKSISENISSKIITQAVKDYPELSRAQAATYIKSRCEFLGYDVSIAATEFIQVKQPPRPEAKAEDKISVLLQNAEDMYKQAKDIERAKKLYEEVVNKAPTNPYGWFGLALITTDNFSVYSRTKMEEAQKYATKALNVATGNDVAKIQSKWNAYMNTYCAKQNEYQRRFSENGKQCGILFYRNEELKDKIQIYKNGKKNIYTLLLFLMKIGFAGIISCVSYLIFVILFYYCNEYLKQFLERIGLETLFSTIFLLGTFGIPFLIFILLCIKFTKRKTSKKTQQKIDVAEKEYYENIKIMDRLKQENTQLQSYL